MSFVLPSTYKSVADSLGAAYAAVRDAIHDPDTGETVYDNVQDSYGLIVDDPDNAVLISSSTDPIGSIANDLGSKWFTVVNNNFSEARAKSTAASLLSALLSALNKHVVRRTGVSNIGSYYSTYSYSASRSSDYNLFIQGDTSSYFTTEFQELSEQLNITINDQFVQP